MRARLAAIAGAAALCACGGAAQSGLGPGPTGGGPADGGAATAGGDRARELPAAPPATAEEEAAAGALFDLANAERRQRGLTPLAVSPELADVARAYCAEMARTGAFAHESPISGSHADRARGAGIGFAVLTENIALAPDAAAAHDGLMRSPGHRANILDPRVSAVGIGALFAEVEGQRSLVVTQMFLAPVDVVAPEAAAAAIGDALTAARRARRLPPVARDPWLAERAADALRSCGGALEYSAGGDGAPPYRVVDGMKVEGGTIAQIAEAIARSALAREPGLTRFGAAVKQIGLPGGGAGGVCAVVLFGAGR